ncbi:protein of unknown function [Cupriavidus taiwanensis]|uniref:Uncharacterized protein n=1 Tax=Cupriavidus taiwanensis TaxID=164546 RepID=A0A375IJE4_9BURK|nr:protein of unknown function [Cupriavidus taiwanensis]
MRTRARTVVPLFSKLAIFSAPLYVCCWDGHSTAAVPLTVGLGHLKAINTHGITLYISGSSIYARF